MKIKQGFEDAVVEATLSWEEFKDQFGKNKRSNEHLYIYGDKPFDKEITGKYYWSNVLGYNYNWTNLQASLALAQLRRIEELIEYKRWLFHEYEKFLRDIEGIQLSAATQNVDPTYWISVAILDKKFGLNKEDVISYFANENIVVSKKYEKS